MVIIDLHVVLEAESCVVTGEPRVRGDMRENAKDKLIREFEDCENGMG